jgi:hypothetical protein
MYLELRKLKYRSFVDRRAPAIHQSRIQCYMVKYMEVDTYLYQSTEYLNTNATNKELNLVL